MPTKFYLHNATTGDSGTLPGAGVSVATTAPTKIASGVNRSMDDTIGTAQASVVLTTNATTASQPSLICRFLSSPIAAQTIAAQLVICSEAFAESSLNSNFLLEMVLAVWRPGTGEVVGRMSDWVSPNFDASRTIEPTSAGVETAFTNSPSNGGTTSVTAQDGDVLVLEYWRDDTAQGMATAYTNTAYYDGTTEGSATTNAAYLLFANNVTMSAGAAANPPYLNPMQPLIVQ